VARAAGAILVLVLAASGAFAGGAGTTGGVGLKLPSAARPTGMGAAFVGLADDANALLWNPAGLSFVSSPEVSLLHTMYLAQTSYQILGYAQPLPLLGTVAASINILDYGKVPRTSERSNGLYGGVIGSNAPQDYYITLGWGDAMPPVFGLDKVRAGVSLKTTVQQLSAGTKYGAGLTGGALWDSPVPGLRAGMVLDNLGASGAGVLPFVWALGGSYNRRLGRDFTGIFALDARVPIDTGLVYNLGAELTGFEMVMVRAGWRGGGVLGGPSLGFGVKYPAKWLDKNFVFKLDYAMASSGELGTSQRFQLSAQLGGAENRPGALKVVIEQGRPVLVWKGAAAAYQVLAQKEGEADLSRLTKTPVTEKRYALADLTEGKYSIKVAVADTTRPDWIGPVSKKMDYTAGTAVGDTVNPVPATALSTTTFQPVVPVTATSSTVFQPVSYQFAPSSTVFRPVAPVPAKSVEKVPAAAPTIYQFDPSATAFQPVASAAAPSSTVFRPAAPVLAKPVEKVPAAAPTIYRFDPSATAFQPAAPASAKPVAQPKK
jgi:hypothetical protein